MEQRLSHPLFAYDILIFLEANLVEGRALQEVLIPRGYSFTLRTKVRIPEGVTLNTLLNQDGSWKTNEILSWFHHDDIPWVLGTLPNIHSSNSMTWNLTPTGQYTVDTGTSLQILLFFSDNSTLKTWLLLVMLAEIAAIHLGIDLALRWSCLDVWVGADCQSVVKALKNGESLPTDWGNLVHNILRISVAILIP
ncbi:hypothetical protein G4B88_007991 [Cannabis sativa]|uniref:RNase H type-1 domain-containing protein n=1 Tax=Cannabis sativa TaxID=3483 RepID=A0A7J6I853_CANSA|nr:hypothetical protein G4B88_007991 [Cannabis sativa]